VDWSFGLSPDASWFVWTLIKTLVLIGGVLGVLPIMIWGERKIAGHVQFRPGPNRVGPFGLLQPAADVLKLVFKEDVIPAGANRVLFILAPILALVPAFVVLTVIPIGPQFVVTDVNVGLLVFFAMSSLGVYAITLAGWAGNNKYGLMGGLRSAAQMISYELSMGLSVIGVILLSGSLSLVDIVNAQSGTIAGFLPKWYILYQPIGFIAFVIAMLAETNRAPFDLPEAEGELVAGYHVEYSSMKFAAFFMGEYANMIAISCVCTVLFLGGWHGPWLPPVWGGIVWFVLKVSILQVFFLFVRWTLPRLRYDQLMNLGWKVLLPLTLANALVTAIAVAFREGWLG
jgi:NADH-quinone oxidoreductase subunit H